MKEKLQQFRAHLAQFVDITAAAQVLSWDQETNMPPGGASGRADQISTLRGLAHQLLVGEQTARFLDELTPLLDELPYDSDDASLIRVVKREYEKRSKIPVELVVEIARTAGLAKEAWKEARAKADYRIFEPMMQRTVELQRKKAECFAPYDNPYDPLLDDYEPGMSYEYINGVFSALKPLLIDLVRQIGEHQDAVDRSILEREVGAAQQIALSREVAARLGYDFEHGRLDLAPHPFTASFGRGDVRITTKVLPDDALSCLMSTIHEAGHGMHGQNISPSLYRTPIGMFSSMSIAESQSCFYENIIGRSRPFWAYWFPRLQEAFAPVYDDVSLDDFYRAVNYSAPSLIRTEADEVTYGLHIMLRFELENDMINGRIDVARLPEEWNARMEAYLGIVPPNDAVGVLQDIHWSQGAIGYFPDYLLGSIYASQLWEKMQQDIPDVEEQIERGEFDEILGWNRDHVMQHGMKFTFPELVERTVGEFSYEPYINYLRTKYGEVYGLA